MKKAKEYRKELEPLRDNKLRDKLVEMVNEFHKEFKESNTTKENQISGKLRELESKFQASVPNIHSPFKKLFRETIIDIQPSIKQAMMW